jgi:hypothetical protein
MNGRGVIHIHIIEMYTTYSHTFLNHSNSSNSFKKSGGHSRIKEGRSVKSWKTWKSDGESLGSENLYMCFNPASSKESLGFQIFLDDSK